MPTDPTLLLIDGHNLLHRAAFGFPTRVKSRSGRDITCAFGFFALLRAAAKYARDPLHIVVVFDGQDGAASRRTLVPSYKPPVIEDELISDDLPSIRDGLKMVGVTCVDDTRYEAAEPIPTIIK